MPDGFFTIKANIKRAIPTAPRIVHEFVSGVNDDPDSTKVRPSDWHAEHVLVSSAWTAYSPAWSSTGTQPSLGDGTLVGRYRYIDPKTVEVHIRFKRGSTSTNGTGEYLFSLPVNSLTDASGIHPTLLSAVLLDAGTRYWNGTAHVRSSANTVAVAGGWATGSEWAATVPFTLAVNDEVVIKGRIELA